MQPVGATTLVPPLAEWHRFSMKQLAGKTAVVTGAASGMGLAFAEAFAAQGMNVVMSDVESGPLAVEAKRIGQSAEVLSMVVDVSKLEQVEAMRDATLERFGAAHVLCNNAGVGGGGDVAECPIDMWEWVLNVDLWGVIYGCKTFLSGMLEQGEGHIVNTASNLWSARLRWQRALQRRKVWRGCPVGDDRRGGRRNRRQRELPVP